MSLRRKVLIRILALLQRKTLIETKNRTLKCLKWLCDQWKMLQCWRRMGHSSSFFVPIPGNLPSKAKNMLIPGGQLRGGAWEQVELTDALLGEFNVAHSEELEVNQWIVQDIHWLSSQSERAKNTIHFFSILYTKGSYFPTKLLDNLCSFPPKTVETKIAQFCSEPDATHSHSWILLNQRQKSVIDRNHNMRFT